MGGAHGWFEEAFGFAEQPSYTRNRARFALEDGGRTLVHPKGRTRIGDFETPSVGELRARLPSEPGPTSLSFANITADVRTLHMKHPDAVFQAASQFNCLEMVGPGVSPDRGVTIYVDDPTQGPACALACPGALAYRNYLVNGTGQGGGPGRQIDLLRDVAPIVGRGAWRMQNGYCLPSAPGSMADVASRLQADPALAEQATLATRVGVHWSTAVRGGRHCVTQVFASALPIAYARGTPLRDWAPLASVCLEAAYDATLAVGSIVAARQPTGRATVYLTCMGGGAFGNPNEWIASALQRALLRHAHQPIDVKLVHYMGSPPRAFAKLEREVAAHLRPAEAATASAPSGTAPRAASPAGGPAAASSRVGGDDKDSFLQRLARHAGCY